MSNHFKEKPGEGRALITANQELDKYARQGLNITNEVRNVVLVAVQRLDDPSIAKVRYEVRDILQEKGVLKLEKMEMPVARKAEKEFSDAQIIMQTTGFLRNYGLELTTSQFNKVVDYAIGQKPKNYDELNRGIEEKLASLGFSVGAPIEGRTRLAVRVSTPEEAMRDSRLIAQIMRGEDSGVQRLGEMKIEGKVAKAGTSAQGREKAHEERKAARAEAKAAGERERAEAREAAKAKRAEESALKAEKEAERKEKLLARREEQKGGAAEEKERRAEIAAEKAAQAKAKKAEDEQERLASIAEKKAKAAEEKFAHEESAKLEKKERLAKFEELKQRAAAEKERKAELARQREEERVAKIAEDKARKEEERAAKEAEKLARLEAKKPMEMPAAPAKKPMDDRTRALMAMMGTTGLPEAKLNLREARKKEPEPKEAGTAEITVQQLEKIVSNRVIELGQAGSALYKLEKFLEDYEAARGNFDQGRRDGRKIEDPVMQAWAKQASLAREKIQMVLPEIKNFRKMCDALEENAPDSNALRGAQRTLTRADGLINRWEA